jgi:hypothetical protein
MSAVVGFQYGGAATATEAVESPIAKLQSKGKLNRLRHKNRKIRY